MFNFDAEQLFVVQPRSAGGGILAFILSLDSATASLDFKQLSVDNKIKAWNDFINGAPDNAHVVGHVNLSHGTHLANIAAADSCSRYVHKNHFYELDGLCEHNADLLTKMHGAKKSIGIYLTDRCIEKILEFRPFTPHVDYYQKWVYANQNKLLAAFYDITSLHHFSFSDMLDIDTFLDHLHYCKDLLDLDIDLSIAKQISLQWYQILKNT
jgi:hypothetical protein